MGSRQEPEFRTGSQTLSFDHVDATETSKAWSRFLANRNAPSMPIMGVRPLIYNSWMRSNTTGIQPEQFAAPSLDKAQIDEKRVFDHSEMRRTAHSCLRNITDLLSGAEAMLILTDKDGVILETVGDKSTLNKGGKINLSVGGIWSEGASGTNGIGTALWTGKPVYVHGEEHFCEGMKAWSCAAAPIHDPIDGSIVGVINLSGLTSIFRKHNAAFAAALARDIDASLQKAQTEMNFQLLEWVVARGPRHAKAGNEGMVIIDRFGRIIFDHTIGGNVAGAQTVQSQGRVFLDLSAGISETAIMAALPPTIICEDIQLIELEGTVKGASLVIANDQARPRKFSSSGRRPIPCTEVGDTGLKIVGRSEAILKALDTAQSLLSTDAPVIIQGPTGVGKELFARLIHAGNNETRQKPFEKINCAWLTKEMLQVGLDLMPSKSSTPGHPIGEEDIEFLIFDEIDELSANLQPVLLAVLEEIMVRPFNQHSPFLPTRILSLTNRSLLDEVATGNFRSDLYYRLGAIVLDIPPLRDRGEDILLIFEHYNHLITERTGREMLHIGLEVEAALMAHDWPGNVRELRNAVYSMHCRAKSRSAVVSDLPFNQEMRNLDRSSHQLGAGRKNLTNPGSLKDAEIALIESVLTAHRGNLSQTAIALGISRPTLYRKLHAYSISFANEN